MADTAASSLVERDSRAPAARSAALAPSRALFTAALGGLLALAAPACQSSDSSGSGAPAGGAGADSGSAGAAGHAGSGAGGTAGQAGADAGSADASAGSAGADADADAIAPLPYCDDAGLVADAGVTSSRVVTMTEAEFRDECEQRGGVFEVIPHCGGLTTCRGMSYDTTTSTLTDHTCRGVNTCAGYSCVICD